MVKAIMKIIGKDISYRKENSNLEGFIMVYEYPDSSNLYVAWVEERNVKCKAFRNLKDAEEYMEKHHYRKCQHQPAK